MAAFNHLPVLVDITPGVTGSWQTVDLTPHVPAGATGVILQTYDGDALTAGHDFGARPLGSTDDRHNLIAHAWATVGISANRRIELYVGVAGPTVMLVGYTSSLVTFFTNGINITPAIADAWVETDLSPHIPAGALGIICECHAGYGVFASNQNFGIRMTGSTDARTHDTRQHSCWPIIGCNDARRVDIYIDIISTWHQEIYLLGYITGGVVFNVNAANVSLIGLNVYTDLPALFEADMGIFEVICTGSGGTNFKYAFRAKGSAEDIYDFVHPKHSWAVVGCDGAGIVEGEIQDVRIDFFSIGKVWVLVLPTVTTNQATSIGLSTATFNGTLVDDGHEPCVCGFEWGETIAYGNTTPTESRTTGQTFSQGISGLLPGHTYHFRAFATNSAGTSYGADRTFTIPLATPTITTDAATGLGAMAATLNGTLDNDGGEACDCSFEWGLDTGYGTTTPIQSKTTGQPFSQVIHGLFPGTTYHFRAFAANSVGMSYGADRSFTTALVIRKAFALAREEL
ncbi:hypothetical protein ES708_00037 [subsurface metagenome]